MASSFHCLCFELATEKQWEGSEEITQSVKCLSSIPLPLKKIAVLAVS